MTRPLHTDEHLDHWGDRFVAAGLADVMSFRRFMAMAPVRRERHIARMELLAAAQRRTTCPPDAVVHGDRLIDPMHHGMRRLRNKFYKRWRARTKPVARMPS